MIFLSKCSRFCCGWPQFLCLGGPYYNPGHPSLSPLGSTLILTLALNWGTIWPSISADIENAKGQIQNFWILLIKKTHIPYLNSPMNARVEYWETRQCATLTFYHSLLKIGDLLHQTSSIEFQWNTTVHASKSCNWPLVQNQWPKLRLYAVIWGVKKASKIHNFVQSIVKAYSNLCKIMFNLKSQRRVWI